MSLLADHGIGFQIPDTAAQINDCRAFLDGYSILNLAAPLDTAIALAPLLLTPQAGVKVASLRGSSFQLQSTSYPRYGSSEFVTAVHKPDDAPAWGDIRADLRYA